jgi:hypothetical protein
VIEKVYEPYSQRWLPFDEWMAATLAEARRRRGIRFTLRNVWLRMRGRPYFIGGRELEREAVAIWAGLLEG